MLRELPSIKRNIKGFEDFSLEGKRGIEPGNPSRSLLFHAFASPNVVGDSNENIISEFPTLAEIETIENYVYGSNPLSILDLKARADGRNIAICVFASEYRPAPETVHKKHADMCYSRTGVSRVGTAAILYVWPVKPGHCMAVPVMVPGVAGVPGLTVTASVLAALVPHELPDVTVISPF